MTRRTTSRAPGMFPGRQPSSHPNPCLGGVCSRYAGSERTPRRSRKVHNDGCQAGSRDGFEPPGGVLAPTPRMVSKRDSQRPIGNTTGPGRETRRRARVPQGAVCPTTRRGSHNAPRVCHSRGHVTKAASRESDSVPLACTANAADRNRGTRRRAGTTVPGPRQRLAQRCLPGGALAPVNAPARAPTNAPLGVSQTLRARDYEGSAPGDPEHFGRGTTRVPRPAIQLRAARSFSARPHTPR